MAALILIGATAIALESCNNSHISCAACPTQTTTTTSSTTTSSTTSSTTTIPQNAGPTAAISSPGSCKVEQTCSFSGATSTGTSLTYEWNWGDGQTGSGVVATHVYVKQYVPQNNSSRAAAVTLTVRDSSQRTNVANATVVVSRNNQP